MFITFFWTIFFVSAGRPRGRPSFPEDNKIGQYFSTLTTPTKTKQSYIGAHGGTYSVDVTAADGTPLSPATVKSKTAIAKKAATLKAKAK